MRNSGTEIPPLNQSLLIQRNLKIADWILLLTGFLLLTGGMMFFGPVKLAFVIAFLALVVIAFFSPKYGLYVLFGTELAYVLIFYINLIAISPSMIGLAYTISFVIDDRGLLVVPLVVLFVSYLMGFVARAWLSKERYVFTSFEKTLLAFLLFCTSWVLVAIAYENFPLIILSDMHIMMIFAFGIFAARVFKSENEFRSLFNFMIIFSLLHWIFLLGFFFQQQLYTQILFLTSLIRFIQGSSDIYSPFIPLMLAMAAVDYPGKKTGLEKHYPVLIFLFIVRTILCLSRGAMLQVILGVAALCFILPARYRPKLYWHIKRQIVYGLALILLLLLVNPKLAITTFKLVEWRTTEGGKSGSEVVSQGSMKYRALETQMVLENISESPIIGYGPGRQTKKRMFTYVSASEEPYVHNGYLWYVLKFGIIGLMFLFYVLVRYFVSLRSVMGRSPPLLTALLAGTCAAFIGIIPIVLTNNVIAAVQGVIFVSFTFGVVIFAERKYAESSVKKTVSERDNG